MPQPQQRFQVADAGLLLRQGFQDAQSDRVRQRLEDAAPVSPLRGRAIRARADFRRTFAASVLLAGEAAGLVNPLTGEGIAPALESGQLAARFARKALEEGDFSATALSAYGRALRERYGKEQRAARILRALFGLPGVVNRLVCRAREDESFARYMAKVIIGFYPVQAALHPKVLFRLLF